MKQRDPQDFKTFLDISVEGTNPREENPMDTLDGNIPPTPETDTSPLRQKPTVSPAKLAANRKNGLKGGRPRGSGMKLVDWKKYQRLWFPGMWDKEIAGLLGVSVRTFKRRKAERQQLDNSF
jgi:hypothetical protein